MLEQIIVVDYVDGAGGEYFAQFFNSHLHTIDYVWLRKYFNSQSLVIEQWDLNFDQHLDEFLSLCEQRRIQQIAVPYHLYKWPNHLAKFSRIAKTVRAVQINSTHYARAVAIDFLRKIYLCPVNKKDISQLAYLTKSATQEQKRQLKEQLDANTLQWIDVTILLNNSTKKQLVDQVLTRKLTCPSQDLCIDYGDFYVDYNDIDNKYCLLCKELELVPNQQLLNSLIDRNKENWAALNSYIEQFLEIYKQL